MDRHHNKYGTHHICGTDAIVSITQGSIINILQQEMLQHLSTRVPDTHGGRTAILWAGSGPLREKKWNSDEGDVWILQLTAEDMSQETEAGVGLSVGNDLKSRARCVFYCTK